MRSKILMGCAVFALSACGQSSSEDNLADSVIDVAPAEEVAAPADVVSMLEEGNGDVCGEEQVQETALGAIHRTYLQFRSEGLDRVPFEVVSATDIDKELPEVSCSASVASDYGTAYPIQYQIRKQVGGGFVVQTRTLDSSIAGTISQKILVFRDARGDFANTSATTATPAPPIEPTATDAVVEPEGDEPVNDETPVENASTEF